MENLFALTYVSEASRDLLDYELDAILLDARLFNASLGVTGALLYCDGRFFQLLEGDEYAVGQAFARIEQAGSHRDIKKLWSGAIAARFFDSWHMGFVRAPTTAIQRLSQAVWEDAIPYTREETERSEGLALLVYYWNKWAAEPLRSES